ncbi:MAG TPA: class I SAM-dependent methyltransferase [Candidatus Limnocylindrales bacterium]
MDLGTGDGRAVLARAAAEPRSLVIGVDAVASAMAESSRRADRRGPANALFLAAAVEALADSPLAGTADLVTVAFPWGSLLRGVVGLDAAALAGVAAPVRPGGGRLEVLASVIPSDGVDGLACLDVAAATRVGEAWACAGLELVEMRPATTAELRAVRSSWARRLGDRPVWRLEGRRDARPGRRLNSRFVFADERARHAAQDAV